MVGLRDLRQGSSRGQASANLQHPMEDNEAEVKKSATTIIRKLTQGL